MTNPSPDFMKASRMVALLLAIGLTFNSVPSLWAQLEEVGDPSVAGESEEDAAKVRDAEARLKAHLDYIKGRLRELIPRYSGNVPPDEPEPQDDGNDYAARYAAFQESYRAQMRKTIQDAMAKQGVPSASKLAFDISSTYSAVSHMWSTFNFGKLDDPDARPADGCYPGFYSYHTCALEASLRDLGAWGPPSAEALEGVDEGMATWKQLDREAEQLMDRLVDGYIRLIKIQVQRDKVTEDFERDAKAFDHLLNRAETQVEWRKQMEPLWERASKARTQLDAEAAAVDKASKEIGARIQQLANTKLFASIRGEGLLEEGRLPLEEELAIEKEPPEPKELASGRAPGGVGGP